MIFAGFLLWWFGLMVYMLWLSFYFRASIHSGWHFAILYMSLLVGVFL